jgi:ABC-type histidine transport system ATPase subunit
MAKLASTAEIIPFKHLVHTKDIRIKAPFHKRLSNRCPHRDHLSLNDEAVLLSLDDDTEDDEVSEEATTIYRIGTAIVMFVVRARLWTHSSAFVNALEFLFNSLAENNLRSFR